MRRERKTHRGGKSGRVQRPMGNYIDMREYGNVALNQLWAGRVVFAQVPFHDRPNESKTRPTVVGAVRGRDVTVFPIYSSAAPWRIEISRHNRRCYVDTRPIMIDKINLVSIDPIDIEDEVLDVLLSKLESA